MSDLARRLMTFGLLPLIVVVDQISKHKILGTPVFNARDCLDRSERCGQIEVSPIFDFTMVWNYGMSFGTLQSEGFMRWVLVALTIGIAIGFAIWLFRAERQLTTLALSLVVAGAIGNVIDRIRFGAVVDFIDVSQMLPWFPWVFNVADSAISVGAVLLFLDQFLLSRSEQKSVKT